MSRVTIHETKTTLSKLVAEVKRGAEVVISRRNMPVARLVPMAAAKPDRKPGRFKGQFTLGPEFFEPLPGEELRLWNGEGE